VPSLERHLDKDIRAGGTADAAANWGEDATAGEEVEFTILRTRVLRRGINLSDPHGAELSTQQKKQNM
jgi:hypothetical protein